MGGRIRDSRRERGECMIWQSAICMSGVVCIYALGAVCA